MQGLATDRRVVTPGLFAYAAGITGIVANLYLIGFYIGEFGPRVPGVPRTTLLPMGATSDLVGALSAALMIPVVLGLSKSLRPGRATRATQAGGIVVMAWLAIAGPLVARGDVDFVVQVPAAQLLFVWIFLTSRLLIRSPSWSGPFRLGRAIGILYLSAVLITVASLLLPWGSPPQQILLGLGLLVGVVAWLAIPFWFLTVGRALMRSELE